MSLCTTFGQYGRASLWSAACCVSQCIELNQQYPVCISHDLEGVYVAASLLVDWHGSIDLFNRACNIDQCSVLFKKIACSCVKDD